MRSHILQLCKLLLTNQCNSELRSDLTLSEPLQTPGAWHAEVTASETFQQKRERKFSNQIRVQKAGTSFTFIVFQAMVIFARE